MNINNYLECFQEKHCYDNNYLIDTDNNFYKGCDLFNHSDKLYLELINDYEKCQNLCQLKCEIFKFCKGGCIADLKYYQNDLSKFCERVNCVVLRNIYNHIMRDFECMK